MLTLMKEINDPTPIYQLFLYIEYQKYNSKIHLKQIKNNHIRSITIDHILREPHQSLFTPIFKQLIPSMEREIAQLRDLILFG